MIGTLYIVATPLGNLQDMTLRAITTLKNVDTIFAEDTRHSLPLLQHFSIEKPLISLHEHNEEKRIPRLIEELLQGKSIALISDAGTPLISDPGFHLVKEARNAGIQIVPIPGPCAAIAALSVSGLPTDRFVFEGFLPNKSTARKERLSDLKNETRTLIFYEAPHRILDLLKDAEEIFGKDRTAVVAREITKMFETIHGATLAELLEWVKQDKNRERGEMVLLVEGAKIAEKDFLEGERVLKILLEEIPLKQAVEITAKITGERKNSLYQTALLLKKF